MEKKWLIEFSSPAVDGIEFPSPLPACYQIALNAFTGQLSFKKPQTGKNLVLVNFLVVGPPAGNYDSVKGILLGENGKDKESLKFKKPKATDL